MLKAIKSYMSDPVGRRFLILLVLVAAMCALLGFAIDTRDLFGKDFLGNLLAEVAGSAVSILVGLFIIDRFIEYRREQQWAKAQNFTLRAIAIHLYEVAGSLFLHFPYLDFGAVDALFEGHIKPFNPRTLDCFDNLLETLPKLPSVMHEPPHGIGLDKSASDVAIEYCEAVKWDLDQIQNVLTPRVMQSPADQTLIDLLIEFDNARRELHHAIIAHKQAVTGGVFSAVVSLMQSAQRLHQAMYEIWCTS